MLFIIFGSRAVTTTRDRGQFHCPKCAARIPYAHKRVRRFFSLYFIPLIPLDLLGEYIECSRCRGTYDVAVLRHDPAKAQAKIEAQFERVAKRTMVMMMLADGVVDDEEIRTIRRVHSNIFKVELSTEDVQAEIRKAQQSPLSLTDQLSKLAGNLNAEGKEVVVQAAFLVAAADGKLEDSETKLLGEIGQALGMTPAHFRGVIDSMGRGE